MKIFEIYSQRFQLNQKNIKTGKFEFDLIVAMLLTTVD